MQEFFTAAESYRPSLMCLKFIGDPIPLIAFGKFKRNILRIKCENKDQSRNVQVLIRLGS